MLNVIKRFCNASPENKYINLRSNLAKLAVYNEYKSDSILLEFEISIVTGFLGDQFSVSDDQ